MEETAAFFPTQIALVDPHPAWIFDSSALVAHCTREMPKTTKKKAVVHDYRKKYLYRELLGGPPRLPKLSAAGKAISAQVRAMHPNVKSEAHMRRLIMAEVNRPQREAKKLEREKAQREEAEKAAKEAEDKAKAIVAEKKLKETLLKDPQRYTRAAFKTTYKAPIPTFR